MTVVEVLLSRRPRRGRVPGQLPGRPECPQRRSLRSAGPGASRAGGRRAAAALLLALLGPVASPAAQQQRPPTPVRVDAVRLDTVQERRLVVGEVRAARRSMVAAQEPGLIVALPVREGDAVSAGDVLCRLDPVRMSLQLDAARAQQAVDEALLEQRRHEAEQTDRDAQTLRDLSSRSAANPKELADAETAAKVARARVAEAERRVAMDEADQKLLAERLDDLTIRAPYDGTVVSRSAEEGEWLGAGDPVVALVSRAVEIWLDAPQQVYGPLVAHRGDVVLSVDATGAELHLADYRLVPDVSSRGRSFAVVLGTSDEADLVSGMSVTAWVPTGAQGQHLTVSKDAILRNDAGTYVFVATGGSESSPPLATPMPVDVMFSAQGRAVLRAGRLTEGMLAVTEGNERLMPMAPLAPIQGDAAMGHATDGKAQDGRGDEHP